jgi:hypothetical protein
VWTASLNPFAFMPIIQAMRITRDATFFPPAFLPLPTKEAVELAVAGNADEWLLSFDDALITIFPNPPPLPRDRQGIRAVRLSKSLELLDAAPLAVATEDREQRHVAVAAGPAGFLVTWDERFGPDVVARTVTLDGFVGEPKSIVQGSLPSTARSGDDFAVAWQDGGNVSYARFDHLPFAIPLAASGDDESNVALCSGPDQTAVAVYERLTSEPVYGNVSRSFARLFTPPAPEPRKRIVPH